MIENTPLAERPRERCLARGAETLSLRECLALILGSGPKGIGCMGLASQLLERPGVGLSGDDEERAFFHSVEVAAPSILKEVRGLGEANQARLLAVFEFSRRYALHREQMKKPRVLPTSVTTLASQALQKVSIPFRNEAREWLGFIPYYRSGSLGELCIVERGVRTHVNIDPVELFARLLVLRPQAFYLVHNHPSGETNPSPPDFELTRKVQLLSRQLGIRLLGHWIVAPESEKWLEAE